MPERLTRADYESFSKAKGLERPGRVMAGGLRAVYLHPDQVALVEGKAINGSRGPAPAQFPELSEEPTLPHPPAQGAA